MSQVRRLRDDSFDSVDFVSSDTWVVNRSPRPYDMLWPVSRNRLLDSVNNKGIPEAQGRVVEALGLMVKRTVHLPSRACFPIPRISNTQLF